MLLTAPDWLPRYDLQAYRFAVNRKCPFASSVMEGEYGNGAVIEQLQALMSLCGAFSSAGFATGLKFVPQNDFHRKVLEVIAANGDQPIPTYTALVERLIAANLVMRTDGVI